MGLKSTPKILCIECHNYLCVTPQSSSSCSYQEQQRILGLFELSQEFKQQHYLTGLLLTELSAALDMESEGYGNTDTFKLLPPYYFLKQ